MDEDGWFLEAHQKLRPVDFANDGVFLCGMAHYPKPLDESIAQARAAASRALTVLSMDTIQVGGIVCSIDADTAPDVLRASTSVPTAPSPLTMSNRVQKSTKPCAKGAALAPPHALRRRRS
jgi:heterodisulfide reductase subunit A-like polyferredoxin